MPCEECSNRLYPCPCARNVGRVRVADRRGRRAPHLAGLLIAQIQHLAGAIGDRIVRPGSDLMFPAVERPGEAAAIGRNLKTKLRIGDHIDPWRGGRLSRRRERSRIRGLARRSLPGH